MAMGRVNLGNGSAKVKKMLADRDWETSYCSR